MGEVCSMSLQEHAMIGHCDGRTHVWHHFGLEVKWFSAIVHHIWYITCWLRSIFCLSKHESVSGAAWHVVVTLVDKILKCFSMYSLLRWNGEMEKFYLGRYGRIEFIIGIFCCDSTLIFQYCLGSDCLARILGVILTLFTCNTQFSSPCSFQLFNSSP
jgi:hypothetical protein